MIGRFSPVLKSVSRIVLVIAVTGSVVGCGSDAMRVDQSTLVNPFNGSSRFGSGPSSNRPVTVAAQETNSYASGASGNRSVQAAPLSSPMGTAVATAPVKQAATAVVNEPKKEWVAAGGKTITVAAGDSVKSLSERYHIPEKALVAANNLKSSKNKLKPGTELVIPVNRSGSAPVEFAAPVQGLNPQASAKVATLQPATKPAAPTAAEVKAQTKADTKTEAASKDEARKSKAAETEKPAKADKASRVAAPSSDTQPETTASLHAQQSAEPASAEFRWPARGHIVQNFGEKAGVKSDGINIALPEGTPVKAAESGVVAYAGNELKGYGNLVLIRHDNGFVSAYANNGDIKVKKGDVIRRGQVIATSGQSGNVTSPQLHFELRKGSTPVDPMQYLSGN